MIHSDKFSDSETTGFASCVSSVKSSSYKTNEPLASAPSSVAFQIMLETADQQPSSTNDDSSFSFKENGLPYVNALAGRPLGAYDLGVATPRALVYAGVMTSGDARSWYMISGDAKSW
ncbi:hypothetical protein Tco_0095753, partial [Tanacetum coccineum]